MFSLHFMKGLMKQQTSSLAHCVRVSQATSIAWRMCLAGSSASLFLIKTESVLEKPSFLFLSVLRSGSISQSAACHFLPSDSCMFNENSVLWKQVFSSHNSLLLSCRNKTLLFSLYSYKNVLCQYYGAEMTKNIWIYSLRVTSVIFMSSSVSV